MTRVLLFPFITTAWTSVVLAIFNIVQATLKMFMMMMMMSAQLSLKTGLFQFRFSFISRVRTVLDQCTGLGRSAADSCEHAICNPKLCLHLHLYSYMSTSKFVH